LVADLKANERCAFDEADLKAMSIDQLSKLSDSLQPVSYLGRGGIRTHREETVPEAPKVVLEKLESKTGEGK